MQTMSCVQRVAASALDRESTVAVVMFPSPFLFDTWFFAQTPRLGRCDGSMDDSMRASDGSENA
jgi:hypothetical protein